MFNARRLITWLNPAVRFDPASAASIPQKRRRFANDGIRMALTTARLHSSTAARQPSLDLRQASMSLPQMG